MSETGSLHNLSLGGRERCPSVSHRPLSANEQTGNLRTRGGRKKTLQRDRWDSSSPCDTERLWYVVVAISKCQSDVTGIKPTPKKKTKNNQLLVLKKKRKNTNPRYEVFRQEPTAKEYPGGNEDYRPEGSYKVQWSQRAALLYKTTMTLQYNLKNGAKTSHGAPGGGAFFVPRQGG